MRRARKPEVCPRERSPVQGKLPAWVMGTLLNSNLYDDAVYLVWCFGISYRVAKRWISRSRAERRAHRRRTRGRSYRTSIIVGGLEFLASIGDQVAKSILAAPYAADASVEHLHPSVSKWLRDHQGDPSITPEEP